ncbi:MAG TPA: ShlB/FhaC/HecB family hemolysin secretion/activation protein [Rhodoferax sp.]
MLKNKFLPCALLALSPAVFAEAPSAGSQMQQIPPVPIQRSAEPGIDFKPVSPTAMAAPDSARIKVNRLRVTGAKAYSEADLLAVTGFQPGSELSLTDLRGMAARIADYYHRSGYFVAQAYLPAQDIKDGIVTIAVIDGQYGKVTLNNQTNVSNALANGLLSGLNTGDVVASAPLENRLLLLSDLPGVKVNSTLVPGAEVGSSDLIVNMTPGNRINGSVDADNAGNRYTGTNRIGATVNYNEPLGLGDVASLRVLTSGKGLNYARGSYQLQFGKATAGVAYSALRYELGEEFAPLEANGTAKVASIYGSYPLIRSRDSNLYAGLNYDAKTFQDRVDTSGVVNDKKAQVLTASLYGNRRDSLGGGGVTGYSLAVSAGNLDLETPDVRALDATKAQTNGHFNKLGFSLSRLQRVTDTVSLSAVVNGQVASKNLDVSEKMELGGMYGVRAYPEGETYADQGFVVNLEARLQVPKFSESMPGQLQLIGFVDAGTVNLNKNPWDPTVSNRRTLSGAGVGLNWSDTNNFMVRAYYAVKIGNEVATSAPDKSGRFWIQAVKYF